MAKSSTSYGQPNGNPRGNLTTATNQREFYRWAETKATMEELKSYVQDETKPATRRKFVKALMKCDSVREFMELTNQTHGMPKQTIGITDAPDIVINLSTKKDGE